MKRFWNKSILKKIASDLEDAIVDMKDEAEQLLTEEESRKKEILDHDDENSDPPE